jgi:hypothetical protein
MCIHISSACQFTGDVADCFCLRTGLLNYAIYGGPKLQGGFYAYTSTGTGNFISQGTLQEISHAGELLYPALLYGRKVQRR